MVFIYPLWLGTMPALLKGLLEPTFRYGFAISNETERMPQKLLSGKSARIIVTMGMPAMIYRWYFGPHSVFSVERSVLKLCGIKPVKHLFISLVENSAKTDQRFAKITRLGRNGK
ncbi:MAG: NAD(P)H-dependent oxidoreductase [Gammaproteobacteria bacterium]